MRALSPFGVACLLGLGSVAAFVPVIADARQMDPAALGSGMVMPAAIRAQANRDAARLRSRRRLAAVSPVAAGTRFTPSLARRTAQSAKFLTAAGRISSEFAKSLAPAFRNDPVRYAAPYLAKYGVRTDDVADLSAVYLVSAWYGAHGRTGEPTRGEFTAVRDQLRRVYAASPKLSARRTRPSKTRAKAASTSRCSTTHSGKR